MALWGYSNSGAFRNPIEKKIGPYFVTSQNPTPTLFHFMGCDCRDQGGPQCIPRLRSTLSSNPYDFYFLFCTTIEKMCTP